MCCALAGPMSAAVATLLRSCKPDRLLIEASGLGHPAGLVDVLRKPPLANSLHLDTIVCLVDPLQVCRHLMPSVLDTHVVATAYMQHHTPLAPLVCSVKLT